MKKLLLLAPSFILLLTSGWATDLVSTGTNIPVVLNHGIDSKSVKAGDPVEARTTQAIHLDADTEVRRNARLSGRIVSITKGKEREPTELSLSFDRLVLSNGEQIPVAVTIVAAASPTEAFDAQIPLTGADEGTSESAWATPLIGGDVRYGIWGPVDARGNEDRKAVGIFSSDAHGVYGLEGLAIGMANDPSIVSLTASGQNLKVPRGTALLVQVKASTPERGEQLSSIKK
jgi:hypothetical protein